MIRGWRFGRRKSARAHRGTPSSNGTPRSNGRHFFSAALVVETLEDRRLLASDAGLVVDPTAHVSSLIVQFRPGAGSASSLAAYAAGSQLGTPWSLTPGMREVHLNASADTQAALAAYRADANVLFAEPDYRVKLQNTIPNDPQFGDQWDMQNTGQLGVGVEGADIHAPAAWDVTTGDPSVVVAVIDTGVDYNHPDLAANMWTNPGEIPGNGVDDDGNGFVDDIHGYDFANHDGDPMDDFFHGTHVAGTIAAVANNGIGISGVAPNVQIMALKFLDGTGSGAISDAISCLNYAVANGASISNNSWGGGGFSQAFQSALQNAASHGHIFVAAAGNDGSNNDSAPFYPANYNVPNVVSVAATDPGDSIAWFSNYGKKTVDIAAPGVDILSTLPTHMTPGMLDEGLSPDYGTLSGTSMAAPHVAGVLALVLSQARTEHPDWGYQDVIHQVLSTADPLESLTGKTVTGGRLNAAAAVGGVQSDTTLPRVVTTDPTGSATGPIDHIRVTFSESIDATTFDAGDIVSLNGPDGFVNVWGVNPVVDNSRQFDVMFDPQVSAGDYTLVLGPHIADLAGNEIDQNGDGIGGLDGDDDYTATFSLVSSNVIASSDVPKSFSGGSELVSSLTIDGDLPIADINVGLNLTYPRDGRLKIWLVSPSGTSVNLSYKNGGTLAGGASANFQDTIFDDEAPALLSDGSAPFTGSFQPDNLLSTFDDENAQGTWELHVQNVVNTSGSGKLNAWSLDITRGQDGDGGGGGGGDGGGGDGGSNPPVAVDDTLTAQQDTPLIVDPSVLLSNDSDADGDPLTIQWVGNAVGGTVAINDDGTIGFTPELGGLAPCTFQYGVSDGTNTSTASVTVLIQPTFYPSHNFSNGPDVDRDGHVSAIDALLVINHLNAYGTTPVDFVHLTTLPPPTLYMDVLPDNVVAPSDVLMVINYINAHRGLTLSVGAAATGMASSSASTSVAGISAATTDSQALAAAAVDQCLASGIDSLAASSQWGGGSKRKPS
jgi:subtilisin family serine protease/subtilisin-like proprotein convertase family protein